jgi:hypothetical protein
MEIHSPFQPLGKHLVEQFGEVLVGVHILKAAQGPLMGHLPQQHSVAVPFGLLRLSVGGLPFPPPAVTATALYFRASVFPGFRMYGNTPTAPAIR